MFDTADILPKARKIDLVVKDLGEEILIYDVNSSKAHSLNETISFIWSKCDGKTTFKTVEKELTKKLDTLIERDFIELALKELKEANLLEDETISFDSISRREVIFRYALPAALAPIVLSVTPTVANAQSCLGAFQQDCTVTPCCPGLICNTPGAPPGSCVPLPPLP